MHIMHDMLAFPPCSFGLFPSCFFVTFPPCLFLFCTTNRTREERKPRPNYVCPRCNAKGEHYRKFCPTIDVRSARCTQACSTGTADRAAVHTCARLARTHVSLCLLGLLPGLLGGRCVSSFGCWMLGINCIFGLSCSLLVFPLLNGLVSGFAGHLFFNATKNPKGPRV